MRSVRLSLLLLAAAPFALTAPASRAQTMVQPLPTGEADQLAAQMRLLASNPQDLNALIRAGELTLQLDDPTAAATFFARAERIDPHNARVEAGMGSLLVGEERPGEALRRFGTAQSLGADPRTFAADRGLAYDLIGEPERAQRDYRLALRDSPSDETERRYALSLGISGKRDEAYRELEPLLRRSDRGAWRARAFILAMSGDRAGAEKIATSMLPAGMAGGLQPFFERLPSLPVADRAFAVHFGEIRATPQRIADARMVPPLPALGPDPSAPVAVADVRQSAAAPVDRHEERRHGKKRKGAPAIEVATAPPPMPLPAPPAYVASKEVDVQATLAQQTARSPYTAATVQPLPSRPDAATAVVQQLPVRSTPTRPPVTLAAVAPNPVRAIPPERNTRMTMTVMPVQPSQSPVQHGESPKVEARPTQTPVMPTPAPVPTPPPVQIPATIPPAPEPIAAPPSATPPTAVQTMPVPTRIETTSIPPSQDAAPATAPVFSPPAPAPVKPAPVRSEDSILASIIAGVKPEAEPESPAVPEPVAASRPPRAEPEAPAAKSVVSEKKAPEVKALDPKKVAADKKAAAVKKAADLKKAADAKELADEKKAAKADPARTWVQVAGGANEDTLPKEWARVRDKAPAAFKGKQGWTTPLRATNRVLAGPFKTDEDARAFVNTLKKEGISAFTFSSDAGQKITRLPGK